MFLAEGAWHVEDKHVCHGCRTKEVGLGQLGKDGRGEVISRWLAVGINQEECNRAFFPLQNWGSTRTLK